MPNKSKHQLLALIRGALSLLSLLYINISLHANPSGQKVVKGTAVFHNKTKHFTVEQLSDKAIVEWNSFSIQKGEVTKFTQPSKHSAILNRVVGKDMSKIYGSLQANGKVYLINERGIFIGPEGKINTKAFIASTLNMANEVFMKGEEMSFIGESDSKIVHQGEIDSPGGEVILISREIESSGKINASGGKVALAAGTEVILLERGLENIGVRVKGEGKIDQKGMIKAAQVMLNAAGGNHFSLAVNQEGIIDASGYQEINGKIILKANEGSIHESGTLSAFEKNQKGGCIHLFASDDITLAASAMIDVSAPLGCGEIVIGRDNQDVLAKNVKVEKGASLLADAKLRGNGGNITLWGEISCITYGDLSAKGGRRSGNGGVIEISSYEVLRPNGNFLTDATNGLPGYVKIDPSDIIIDDYSGRNGTYPEWNPSTPTIYDPEGKPNPARLDVDDLLAVLAQSDVTVTTASGRKGKGDIDVRTDIIWDAPTTLRLLADRTLTIDADIINTHDQSTSSWTAMNFRGRLGGESGSGDDDDEDSKMLKGYSGRFKSGIRIKSGHVLSSIEGDILLFGGSEDLTSSNQVRTNGVTIETRAKVLSLGTGEIAANIVIDGIGGSKGSTNHGVEIQKDASIESKKGNISIFGRNDLQEKGGEDEDSSHLLNLTCHKDKGNFGVKIDDAQIITEGIGDILIRGISEKASQDSIGVSISDVKIFSHDGSITLDGHSKGTKKNSAGLLVEDRSDICSMGSGKLFLEGEGGSGSTKYGLSLENGTFLRSFDGGDITLTADCLNIQGAVSSSGYLHLQPKTPSLPITVGDSLTGFVINGDFLSKFEKGFSKIIIGRFDGSHHITVQSNQNWLSFQDVLELRSDRTDVLSPLFLDGHALSIYIGQTKDGLLNCNQTIQASHVDAFGGDHNDDFHILIAPSSMTIDGKALGINRIYGPNSNTLWVYDGEEGGSGGNIQFSHIHHLYGGNQTDTLQGPCEGADWVISRSNGGTVGDLSFYNIENLTGSTKASDHFVVEDGAMISGHIDGNSNINYFNTLTARGEWVSTGECEGYVTPCVGSFSNIHLFDGADESSINGSVNGSDWRITYKNSGYVDNVPFIGMAYLIGGEQGSDRFLFEERGYLTGGIDGKSLNQRNGIHAIGDYYLTAKHTGFIDDILPEFNNIHLLEGRGYSSLSSKINNAHWYLIGSNEGILKETSYKNMKEIIGNNTSYLHGPMEGATWDVTGSCSGEICGVKFSGMPHLVGSPMGADNFQFHEQGIIHSIDGGSFSHENKIVSYGNRNWEITSDIHGKLDTNLDIFVNISLIEGKGNDQLSGPISGADVFLTSAQSGKIGKIHFDGIESLIGRGDHDIIHGPTGGAEWEINRQYGGEVQNLVFEGFEKIIGSETYPDIFRMHDGGYIQTIDGRGAENQNCLVGLDTTEWHINSDNTGSIDNKLTHFENIHLLRGQGNDTVHGPDVATDFYLTSGQQGHLYNISFEGIDQLQGHSTSDIIHGPTGGAEWEINRQHGGEVQSLVFEGFEKIIGSDNNSNIFRIHDGGYITHIDAGSTIGNNILVSFGTSYWKVFDFHSGAIEDQVGLFENVHILKGQGEDSLTGNDKGYDWLLASSKRGFVAGMQFEGMEKICGGSGYDRLNGPNSKLHWLVNGDGMGSVAETQFEKMDELISSIDHNNLFELTAEGRIHKIIAGSQANKNTLVAKGENIWHIDDVYEGSIEGKIDAFEGITDIEADINSTLIGPAGGNDWKITGDKEGILCDVAFSKMGKLIGLGLQNRLSGIDIGSYWEILRSNGGRVSQMDFDGFPVLLGGREGPDQYTLYEGGSIEKIDANSSHENNCLISNYPSSDWMIDNEREGHIIHVAGSFIGIKNITGQGIDKLTGRDSGEIWNLADERVGTVADMNFWGFGTLVGLNGYDTLYGPENIGAIYQIDGINQGNVLGTNFEGIDQLIGSKRDDRFIISDLGSIQVIEGGSKSSNNMLECHGQSLEWCLSDDQEGLIVDRVQHFSQIDQLIGNGDDHLYGPNQNVSWVLTDAHEGRVENTFFRGMSNVYGNESEDILSLQGRGGSWLVDGMNTGNVLDTRFSKMSKLVGSASYDDDFHIEEPGFVEYIDGGSEPTYNTLSGYGKTVWHITGRNSGAVEDAVGQFINIDFLEGKGQDILMGPDGGNEWQITQDGQGSVLGVGFTGMETVVSTSSNDRLQGPLTGSHWHITGTYCGRVNETRFEGFEHLIGSPNGSDTFEFYPSGIMTSIKGGSTSSHNSLIGHGSWNYFLEEPQKGSIENILGSFSQIDLLDGKNIGFLHGPEYACNWQLEKSKCGSIGDQDFIGMRSLIARTENNTLFGPQEGVDWNIHSSRSGTVQNTVFLNFYSLCGSDVKSDHFFFNTDGYIDHIIGGKQSVGNKISLPQASYAILINEHQGRVVDKIGSFEKIESLSAQDNSILKGPETGKHWTITGLNKGEVAETYFEGFGSLIGSSSAVDAFELLTGSSIERIDGGSFAEENVLTTCGPQQWFLDDSQTGSVQNVVGNFSNIAKLYGNGTDSITGPQGQQVWDIDEQGQGRVAGTEFYGMGTVIGRDGEDVLTGPPEGANYYVTNVNEGRVVNTAFRGIGTLIGSTTSNDRFIFEEAGSIDHIDGGQTSYNSLTVSSPHEWVLVDRDHGYIRDIVNSFCHIDLLIGGGEDKLIGPFGEHHWQLTGDGQGSVSGVDFSGMKTIVASNSQDRLIGPLSGAHWHITGNYIGRVNGTNFEGFEHLIGSSNAPDIFECYSQGIMRSIRGGSSSNDSIIGHGEWDYILEKPQKGTIEGVIHKFSQIDWIDGNDLGTLYGPEYACKWQLTESRRGEVNDQSFIGIKSLIARAENNKLLGPEEGSDWQIHAQRSGVLCNTLFSNFYILKGSDVNPDHFIFDEMGYVDRVVGGLQSLNNRISLPKDSHAVLDHAHIGYVVDKVGSFEKIDRLSALENSSLKGPESGKYWKVTGHNEGKVGDTNFTGFSNLIGSSTADDIFEVVEGASIGQIDGGSLLGRNTLKTFGAQEWFLTGKRKGAVLDLVDCFTNISRLEGKGEDRLTGPATKQVWELHRKGDGHVAETEFVGMETIIGRDGADILNGPQGGACFTVTGNHSGSVVNTNFQGMGTLVGSLFADNQFVVEDVGQIDYIDGGVNSYNSLAVYGSNEWILIDKNRGYVQDNVKSYAHIDLLIGKGEDRLYGPEAPTTWQLNAKGIGSVCGVDFKGMEFLISRSGQDTLIGPDKGEQSWFITGDKKGTVVETSFENMNSIVGSQHHDDRFIIQDGGYLPYIDGGSHSSYNALEAYGTNSWFIEADHEGYLPGGVDQFVNIHSFRGKGDDILYGPSSFQIWNLIDERKGNVASIDFQGMEKLIGRGVADTLIGPEMGSIWVVRGENSGSVRNTDFKNIASLVGSSVYNDTFKLEENGSIISIDGGSADTYNKLVVFGTNTWQITGEKSGYVEPSVHNFMNIHLLKGKGEDVLSGPHRELVWTLTDSRTGHVAGMDFVGMETLLAHSGNDTLIGPDSGSAWRLKGENSGNVANTKFEGMAHFIGSHIHDDSFYIRTQGKVKSIDGGSSETKNTIEGEDGIDKWQIDGFNRGRVPYHIDNFVNIHVLEPTAENNLLMGPNTSLEGSHNTWKMTDTNTGALANISFSKMAHLLGRNGNDLFDLSDGFVTGSIHGGGGNNTLIGQRWGNQFNLYGQHNHGDVNGLPFLDIQNLTGGSEGLDFFILDDGIGVTGIIDGNSSHRNTMDYSAYSTSWYIDIENGQATNTAGIRNIYYVIGDDGSGRHPHDRSQSVSFSSINTLLSLSVKNNQRDQLLWDVDDVIEWEGMNLWTDISNWKLQVKMFADNVHPSFYGWRNNIKKIPSNFAFIKRKRHFFYLPQFRVP